MDLNETVIDFNELVSHTNEMLKKEFTHSSNLIFARKLILSYCMSLCIYFIFAFSIMPT